MDGEPPRATKRRRLPRASQACNWCRTRKTKCDQLRPCSYCAYHSLECVYKTSDIESISSATKKNAGAKEIDIPVNQARLSPWPEGAALTSRVRRQYDPGETLGRSEADAPSPSPIQPAIRSTGQWNLPLAPAPLPTSPTEDCTPRTVDGAPSEIGDSSSRVGLSGVNIHTNGTEFYGNSSNLAFLGNLYSRARNQARTASSQDSPPNGSHGGQTLAQSPFSLALDKDSDREGPTQEKEQLSIVNLLHNPNFPTKAASVDQQSAPQQDKELRRSKSGSLADHACRNGRRPEMALLVRSIPDESQFEIEKMFISSYFSNKHWVHPMLDKPRFMHRCEAEAWHAPGRARFLNGSSKFTGLYFAVVAMGAINSSPNETALLDHYCTYSPDPTARTGPASGFSALDFAEFYFEMAKQTLGDIFESCSLESAQALLILSVYCQNALRPHSCFMYSGMAVRTAVAIGLASGFSSPSACIRKEGKRTWWSIYSHEVEMCCSSGRLDSMKALNHYHVSLPKLKADPGNGSDPDAEDNEIGMIPVMVALAKIMSEASHLIYHETTERSMTEMSRIAMDLDKKLLDWKESLPSFLSIDVAALNDPEWAFKQRLVLKLRFYNTRILIHRPFLVASTVNSSDSPNLLPHLQICLNASRFSIQMQYESFLHRIYIRTWWYNTTYALYASMILLHLVLSDFPGISCKDLLQDVEKSLEIFSSMGDMLVVRRCGEMIKEVLEVARMCLARRQALTTAPPFPSGGASSSSSSSILAPSQQPWSVQGHTEPGWHHGRSSHTTHSHPTTTTPLGQPIETTTTTTGGSGSALLPNSAGGNGDFFSTLFSQDGIDNDTDWNARAEILANLVDPGVLEDFAFGGGGAGDFSLFYSA